MEEIVKALVQRIRRLETKDPGPAIYMQTTDPGAVGAYSLWLDTSTDTLYYRDSTDTSWISIAGGGGGMANPMTTLGDIIVAIAAGAPDRLGIGSAGEVLTVVAGSPSWEPIPTQATQDHDHSGHAGDGNTFDAANLTSGASGDGQVLTSDGLGGAAWEGLPAVGSHDILSATHDDTTVSAPSDQDVLTWDDASGKWIAQAPPAAGPHTILSHSDADPTAPNDQDVLTWDDGAGEWKAQASAGGAPTDYPYLGIGSDAGLSAEVDVHTTYPINEVMGWPPYVPDTTDLNALSLWWRSIGTPSTAPTVTHVAGIGGGVTEDFERCIKVVTDAANEGCETLPWTYADQPRIKSGKKLSAFVYVWCVGGVGVTVTLLNSDASSTSAVKVTAAAWTAVEVPNHTLADSSCKLQFIADGAGTFYVAMPCANIGTRGFPLPPRPSRFVNSPALHVNGADPANTNWTDVDVTAATSPLTWAIPLIGFNSTSSGTYKVHVRRNGSSEGQAVQNEISELGISMSFFEPLDDAQIYEYSANNAAVNNVYQWSQGYWEWS